MFPRKSTAISDIVLALTCIYALVVLLQQGDANNNKIFGVIWFTLALASTVIGGFRYGIFHLNLYIFYFQKRFLFRLSHCRLFPTIGILALLSVMVIYFHFYILIFS